ncbi:MAG: [FeFe] hydrogenase H-cluster maturation GTPase HydF [Lachnospiraceae bacterium]|nr:[FeFe] hydrogenase H-cluster maturation GTPase HydF [Lachnospiraceae bacterium]
MSMNDTPKGERLHIALFGKRNAGKSSLVNAITNQELSIVSEVKGTTTDPVYKAMEILPIGPVMLVDTPGLDDEGELGKLRLEKAREVLEKADVVLIVVDGSDSGDLTLEYALEEELKKKKIPYMWIYNKADLYTNTKEGHFWVSAKSGEGIHNLKEYLKTLVPKDNDKTIIQDFICRGDVVVLVIPIDKAAPKGRLILPQQQTIRDILEAGAISVVVRDTELQETMEGLGQKPKLVITDSQAFAKVNKIVPKDVLLTSFSILFARYKGELDIMIEGLKAINNLQDGDKLLMAEGCTHHRQCGDIGTQKLPKWIQEHTGKNLVFETSSGAGFPKDLSNFKVVVHCGGCTLQQKEMERRIASAGASNIPIVNYGLLISYLNGILPRTLEIFGDSYKEKWSCLEELDV